MEGRLAPAAAMRNVFVTSQKTNGYPIRPCDATPKAHQPEIRHQGKVTQVTLAQHQARELVATGAVSRRMSLAQPGPPGAGARDR